MSMIDAHIIHPQSDPQLSVIWLHGLGADGFDFAPIASELNLDHPGVKFIFPHAPLRPITLNNGLPMRGWYDIFTLDRDSFTHDVPGIRTSVAMVQRLIEAEIKAGIPVHKIILAGFSQGGAIALFAGLTSSIPIGGILALSTYLPAPEIVALEKQPQTPPILLIHGSEDQIILLEYAELSRELLLEMGCAVEFEVYPMGHTLCNEEVKKISQWLKER